MNVARSAPTPPPSLVGRGPYLELEGCSCQSPPPTRCGPRERATDLDPRPRHQSVKEFVDIWHTGDGARPGNSRPSTVVGTAMDAAITQAMRAGGIADITTTGRKSGEPRRIEIYFHHFDGEYYLTGRPGFPRGWVANILANPTFTLHLKKGLTADVEVVGEPEPDPAERARILRRALIENWDSPPDRVDASLQKWVDTSPFIRFRPVED